MSTTLDRDSLARRFVATGALLAIAGLSGCGNNNSYYTVDLPAAITIADFNGSGYPGIAVAEAQENELEPTEQPGFVALVLQDQSSLGSYQPSLIFGTQGDPSAIAAGALTPGTMDLAVANVNDATVSVLIESAANTPSFKPVVNLLVAPGATAGDLLPEDVAICDVNNDGHPDIVVAYKTQKEVVQDLEGADEDEVAGVGGGVSVILQNASSPGTFEAATNVGTTPAPTGLTYPNVSYGVACGNLSGDSTAPPDIVMTSFSDYDVTGELGTEYDGGTVSIFFHDPAHPGSFLPRVDISVPGALRKVVIEDVNHDGLPDIIVADESEDSDAMGEAGVVVLLQTPPATPGAQPTFAAPVTYETASPVGLAVGDLTGSGLPDVAVVNAGDEEEGIAGTISVLLNSTTTPGTFALSADSPYASLGNPVSVAIGSLDGKAGTLQDLALADGTGAAVMMNTPSDPGTLQVETLVGD